MSPPDILRHLHVLCLTLVCIGFTSSSFALSHYGRSCYANTQCVSCKEDMKCLSCLHDCYNAYGVADTIPGQKLDRDQYCKKKQAKWCAAQCWDPDDTDKENYVSTKPRCYQPF